MIQAIKMMQGEIVQGRTTGHGKVLSRAVAGLHSIDAKNQTEDTDQAAPALI
jgi:hypothetical protein